LLKQNHNKKRIQAERDLKGHQKKTVEAAGVLSQNTIGKSFFRSFCFSFVKIIERLA